jgi:hypothetical protein
VLPTRQPTTQPSVRPSTFTERSLSPGLIFTIYNGYFNDNPNYFLTASRRTGLNGQSTGTTLSLATFSLATNGNTPNNWDDYYSIEWKGFFYTNTEYSSGSWTFCSASDDASFVWIGDIAIVGYTTTNALINNGGLHSVREVCASVSLLRGKFYGLRIQFGESGGGDSMTFCFQPPGTATCQNLPNYYYNPNPSSPPSRQVISYFSYFFIYSLSFISFHANLV